MQYTAIFVMITHNIQGSNMILKTQDVRKGIHILCDCAAAVIEYLNPNFLCAFL